MREVELERLQHQPQGTTQGWMLRGIADTIEVLATSTLLVLVLEDLQLYGIATGAGASARAGNGSPGRGGDSRVSTAGLGTGAVWTWAGGGTAFGILVS